MCLHIKYFWYHVTIWALCTYTVFQKTSTFLFFNNSVISTDCYNFLVYNILMNMAIRRLQICPSHLYTVAALPWEMTKVCFQQCYSYVFPNT